MITIISGTNRVGSETLKFAKKFKDILSEKTDLSVKLLDLAAIPQDFLAIDMYKAANQSASITKLQDEYLIGVDKILYVMPEYNGSFPGVLKLFLDACSIREYKDTFRNKKAAICGVASGRAGNLRGIDHLTGVLHHVGTLVKPGGLPLSSIGKLMDENGNIADPGTLQAMEAFMDSFIEF